MYYYQLMHSYAKGEFCEIFPQIYVDSKEEGKVMTFYKFFG